MSNDEEFLQTASLASTESVLSQVHLCTDDQVVRLENMHMPEAVFFSKFQDEKHKL